MTDVTNVSSTYEKLFDKPAEHLVSLLKERDRDIQILRNALLNANRQKYGAKTEKLTSEQIGFSFNVSREPEQQPLEKEIIVPQHKRTIRKGRKPLPANLPHEEIVYQPEQTHCQCCKAELVVIGEERSEELEKIPAQLKVIIHIRVKTSDDRLEYSKEAAREVIRNLKDEDFVGVIGFDDSPFEVVKLGRVRDIRAHGMERVSRLFPDRRTNLFPSMEEARRRLKAADAGRKHMIVLTDGKLPDASQAYVEMVKEMRLVGITVSTVMIGSEYDAGFLRSLAEYGGGAYYQTDNPSTLPRIFIQDVKVRSGEKTMKEAEEFAVRTGPSGLKSTDIGAYPPLRGYVQTSRRREADLELVVTAAEKADPLLASWRYGQGRSIAFTSDANGRWSSMWAGWPKFQTFWSELVEAARAKGTQKEEGPIRFDLRRSVEQDRLVLDLSVFQDVGNAEIKGSLLLPNENKEEMVFEKVAPGHYKAELPKAAAGKYVLDAAVGAGSSLRLPSICQENSLERRRDRALMFLCLRGLPRARAGRRIRAKRRCLKKRS